MHYIYADTENITYAVEVTAQWAFTSMFLSFADQHQLELAEAQTQALTDVIDSYETKIKVCRAQLTFFNLCHTSNTC